MATEVSAAPMALPQLQSVQKAMAIPTVGAAVGQVGALYTRVKDAHSLFEWALSTAEAGVTLAAHTAAPFVSAPLAVGDAKMAGYIDALERKVPLVNEQPQVIVETTKKAVLSKISPHVNKVMGCRVAAEQRVKSLKDLSWAKANALLSTAYGQKALIGVDSGATYAMQLLDHYLPPVGPQEESVEIVAATNDPALHTMQTVGRLSAVAARRVWANLAYKVHELRQSGIDFDVSRYLKALLAALHLAAVTNQQHQQETAAAPPAPGAPAPAPGAPAPAPGAPAPAEPTTTAAPPVNHISAPTTANKVKTTPEAKSETHSNKTNVLN